ncbi:MAG: hypothetical protein GXY55_05355 [Phycisphaerae bacterium]|nr:hypothetical protein [Phycisphaerae bacterium]
MVNTLAPGRWSLLLLVPLLLASCDSVISTVPLGTPSQDAAVNKSLDGVWLGGDGQVLYIKHVNDGELRIAGVEWKDGRFQLSELAAYLTIEQDVRYVNLVDPESDKEKPKYLLARLAPTTGDDLVVYPPQAAAFAEAVNERRLSGTVTKHKHSTAVELTADKDRLDAFVDPEQVGRQFQIDTPVVLRRIGKVGE